MERYFGNYLRIPQSRESEHKQGKERNIYCHYDEYDSPHIPSDVFRSIEYYAQFKYREVVERYKQVNSHHGEEQKDS